MIVSLDASHVLALQHLAQELATQDNAITSDPLFTVQQKRRQYGMDPDYCEGVAWVDAEDYDAVHSDATDPEERAKFQLLERFHAGEGEIEWPSDLGAEDCWSRTGYLDRWEFVQAFLTLKAAEAFRRDQAHNLGETRIYVESGYRNPEWKLLREIVARFGHDPVLDEDSPLSAEQVWKIYWSWDQESCASNALHRQRVEKLQARCTHQNADGTRAPVSVDPVDCDTSCAACGKDL